jgi:hypothetical protein
MKHISKEQLAKNLDEKDFHTPIRKNILELAKANNLLIVFSEHLDFIRFDGAYYDYVYADSAPFFIGPNGLLRNKDNATKTLEINPYKFGKRRGDEVSPALYTRLGKPVWDFLTDEVTEKAAPFHVRERQDFGDGTKYFCRGIVIDLERLEALDWRL